MNIDLDKIVLWVDEALLVVNKPPGLPVLPDGYHPEAPYLRGSLEPLYGRLWTVHRLDKETSGAVVLARTAAAHRHLNTQFQEHQTNKIYHALVVGVPEWEEQMVEAPLLPDGDRRHRTIVSAQGKPAQTHFRLLQRFTGYALVEATPRTGRTHQIRAHLAHIGHPIVGDHLYGCASALLGRAGLHASSLELVHPMSGEMMRFSAPYPEDFQGVLRQLEEI